MSISQEEIKKIATLARLDLSEAEVLQYQKQLSSVLKYIDALKEVDIKDLEVLGLHSQEFNKTREDLFMRWPQTEVKTALSQAKEIMDDQIKVQRVL